MLNPYTVVQVLKLWNLTAQLFSAKISRGSEVSNEPDRTQLISLINFITVPFKLKPPTDKASACPETLMNKFKCEFAQLFKGIRVKHFLSQNEVKFGTFESGNYDCNIHSNNWLGQAGHYLFLSFFRIYSERSSVNRHHKNDPKKDF